MKKSGNSSQSISSNSDPYSIRPEDLQEPPKKLSQKLRKIGPGMIIGATLVGTGELLATTTLGAEVGYTLMWLIIFSCVIKTVVQAFLGRHAVIYGETSFVAFNRLPGRLWGINWIIWAWGIMILVGTTTACAMLIGIAQVLNLAIPPLFSKPNTNVSFWVATLQIITILLVLKGSYKRIEVISIASVVIFTFITTLAAIILIRMPEYFSWTELASGLSFQLPDAGLGMAIAVFGITGVGAYEIFAYPMWCVEKGYGKYTGKNDGTEQWRSRARGWISVMHLDITVSMIIYTFATVAFYLLGAGILHNMDSVPEKTEMILTLSNIYTQTLGEWAKPVFYIGAIVVLFSTLFGATAGVSRMFADLLSVAGVFPKNDFNARQKWRDGYVVFAGIFTILLYFLVGQAPIIMLIIGGTSQTLMIPIISVGTIYLTHKYLPSEMRAGLTMTSLLWIATIVICTFVIFSQYRHFLAN